MKNDINENKPLNKANVSRRPCDIKDRNGKEIFFGDKLRFVDKIEWYRNEYWSKVAF